MRVLLIDDRVPDPHFGAGFPRAYRLLLSLLQLGHEIYFFPTMKETIKELNIELLKNHGIEVVEDIEKIKNEKIDVTIMSRPHNVHYYLDVVKKYLPASKIIYDTEALWYRRYDLQLSITGKLPNWAYRYDEIGMARIVDMCFVVNNTEKAILEENNVNKVRRLAHALDINQDGLPFESREGVLVVGGILEEDSSNEDALWWFLENCWENIQIQLKCKLNITGKHHSTRLKNCNLAEVNLMGHVNDLSLLYQNQKVFVATTRFATGIPWKVHEAMSNGIPCVISKLLADQLNAIDNVDAMVANNATEAIEKTVKLYSDSELWNKIRENGFKLVKRDCDPEDFKQIISASLSDLFA